MLPVADKPWLESYHPDVPHEIDPSRYGSLVDLLNEAFKTHASRDAAAFMGQRMTFRDLDERSAALAAWLQSKSLAKGARVALMMPNVPQYMVAIAGVLRAGLVVVNVNPLYTARELQHQLVDSGAEAIVVLENFAHTLEEVIESTHVKHVLLASIGGMLGFWQGRFIDFAVRHVKKMVPPFSLPLDDGRSVMHFNDALAAGAQMSFRAADLGAEDLAFLQYTGGTTGVSKGAMLTHRNIVANILQSETWFLPELHHLEGKQPVIVCALPLYHIFALTACYMLGARIGAMNLLIANPRDIPSFVRTLSGYRVHVFPAVNTLFNALANDPEFARLDFSELRISNGGGMAVQRATADQWLALTGCPVVEGYGLSETSPVVTVNRLDAREFNGTVGLPVPSTEISIRDDQGAPLPFGEPGEVCIRGPQVMAGYWNRPEETAAVTTADGFFRSGDIGVMDAQGFVRLVDRKKDMILVSGFNVYPNELEQVISLHPGVLECAAVGVEDARTGEAVKLFVVKRDPALEETELQEYCAKNFTAYKRPKYIEFRDELPKSNVGKILRRELRAS